MRKQYHSKKVNGDIFIWDVDNLISKSSTLAIFEIKLSEIKEFEENYWYLNENDTPTCKSIVKHFELVKKCNLDYPIILSDDGTLMDGMHRVCKAHLNKQESINAVQFPKTPKPDFINLKLDELPYDS